MAEATKTSQSPFISYLRELAEQKDRAALAALRRGLGKPAGTATEMFPYVTRFIPTQASVRHQNVFYLVASLFALHPKDWQAREGYFSNLGASFALLREATGSDSIEGRFTALLNAHHDELDIHLRHAVGLMEAKDIAVNWEQLLKDIQHWDRDDRRVQRNWARAYWGARPGDATDDTNTNQGTAANLGQSE